MRSIQEFLLSILVIVFIFVYITVAQGQIVIPIKYRVQNIDPGYCSWCCIETLGNFHKIKALENLVQRRMKDPNIWIEVNGKKEYWKVNEGRDWTIRWKLDELKVNYKMSDYGGYDLGVIEYGIKNKLGCIVAIRTSPEPKASSHAVILVSYNEKSVVFIDPNDLELHEQSRTHFDSIWTGHALVIIPQGVP